MHIPDAIRFPMADDSTKEHSYGPAALFAVERQVILETARYCNGNVSEMAKMLGIGRTTLWRKMKQFNIAAKDFKRVTAD
jgi:transcriptional activator for dhaKLM operon